MSRTPGTANFLEGPKGEKDARECSGSHLWTSRRHNHHINGGVCWRKTKFSPEFSQSLLSTHCHGLHCRETIWWGLWQLSRGTRSNSAPPLVDALNTKTVLLWSSCSLGMEKLTQKAEMLNRVIRDVEEYQLVIFSEDSECKKLVCGNDVIEVDLLPPYHCPGDHLWWGGA